MLQEMRTRRRRATIDGNAGAYFQAAGISDTTEVVAANTLILGLKAANLWNRIDRIYLISRTSMAAALYCAKSLTQMTAVNAPTHASTGISFNGTTQYLDCNVAPNALTNYLQNNASFSIYSRSQDWVGASFPMAIAADGATSAGLFANPGLNRADYRVNQVAVGASTSNTYPGSFYQGLFACNRSGAAAHQIYRNGSLNNSSTVASAARGSNNWLIAASTGPAFYGGPETAFAHIGGSMSAGEQSTFYTLVQAYQTSLGRQV